MMIVDDDDNDNDNDNDDNDIGFCRPYFKCLFASSAVLAPVPNVCLSFPVSILLLTNRSQAD